MCFRIKNIANLCGKTSKERTKTNNKTNLVTVTFIKMSLIETKREVKIRVYTNCLHACARVEEGGGGNSQTKGIRAGLGTRGDGHPRLWVRRCLDACAKVKGYLKDLLRFLGHFELVNCSLRVSLPPYLFSFLFFLLFLRDGKTLLKTKWHEHT